MGEMVEFASNGGTASGYAAGGGPGLIVIQEWWGLNDQIKDTCDRFADQGFTALAPDLYHGASASEPDGAGKLMMGMNLAQAGKDLSGAVDWLLARTGRAGIGVTGYCMGGGLALVLACQRPDAVAACVPFYGVIPWPSAQPDWSAMRAAVQGHYAELDDFAPPASVEQLGQLLRDQGRQVDMYIYPGTQHAFCNDRRPEVYDEQACRTAFGRTVDFLRATLSA